MSICSVDQARVWMPCASYLGVGKQTCRALHSGAGDAGAVTVGIVATCISREAAAARVARPGARRAVQGIAARDDVGVLWRCRAACCHVGVVEPHFL